MLIVFLILIFGFFTADRILKDFFGQNILTRKQMTNFGTAYVLLIVLISFLVENIFVIWLTAFTPHIVFLLFISCLKRFPPKEIRRAIRRITRTSHVEDEIGPSFSNCVQRSH